jgi:hypothetical protein
MPPDDNPGVPLAHYRDHQAGVHLYCRDCCFTRDLELEAVISRLRLAASVTRAAAFAPWPALCERPRCRGWGRPVAADQLPPGLS